MLMMMRGALTNSVDEYYVLVLFLSLFLVVVLVSNITALLQCLTLIRQHQLSAADVTVQDLKIADYGNSFTALNLSNLYIYIYILCKSYQST